MKKDRRKINNAMSRRAAARRVQEKVEAHDEQVVVFIWGCRILGWSLRRIAAALDASIAPPGQRAGYKAGKWTAAAVQRICRRYEIRTDRAPYPPASLLRYIRAGVTISRRGGGPRPVHVRDCQGPRAGSRISQSGAIGFEAPGNSQARSAAFCGCQSKRWPFRQSHGATNWPLQIPRPAFRASSSEATYRVE